MSTSGPAPSPKVPVPSVKWAANPWWVPAGLTGKSIFERHCVERRLRFLSQVENGKLSEHEHGSTMEHLHLLLPMVLSLTRTRAEVSDSGEWQEDSGLGLYRAPEEGVNAGAGAAASVHAVDLEKKVRPVARRLFSVSILYVAFHTSVGASRQVTALENIICVLNREVERSAVKVEAFAHQHCLDQEKIENLVSKLGQLERAIAMRDLQLSETEQLVRELQSCTYDGIFVWKISEFSRRRQEAVAGRMPAMFSPGERRHAWSCFFFFFCWRRCFKADITLWFCSTQHFTPVNMATKCA